MSSKTTFTYVALSVALLMVGGCATGSRFTQATQVPPNKALVYVYMKGGVIGAANSWDILANHQRIGVMRKGAYLAYDATPGHLVLGTKFRPSFGGIIEGLTSWEHGSLELDLAPGSTRYVTLSVGFMGPAYGQKLVEVERIRAESEIQDCKHAEEAR